LISGCGELIRPIQKGSADTLIESVGGTVLVDRLPDDAGLGCGPGPVRFVRAVKAAYAGAAPIQPVNPCHEWLSAPSASHAYGQITALGWPVDCQIVQDAWHEHRRFRSVDLLAGAQDVLVQVIAMPWLLFHPRLEGAEPKPLLGHLASLIVAVIALTEAAPEKPFPPAVERAVVIAGQIVDTDPKNQCSSHGDLLCIKAASVKWL